MTDPELLQAIRREIAESPFVGEGHKKICARLRLRRICTSRKRVLRLMREAGLLAPTPKVRKRAKRLHTGRITTDTPGRAVGDRSDRGLDAPGRALRGVRDRRSLHR